MMPLKPLQLSISAIDASPFPLDISLVKQHLAVDDTNSDTLIEAYMQGAVAWAEGAMHRTIYARSHRWVLKDFPRDCDPRIRLPRGKTQSVESIQYVNARQTLTLTGPSSGSPAGSDWQEDLHDDDGGVLLSPQGGIWPSVDYDAVSPVVINFTAGWLTAEVPSDVIHALLFAVSDSHDTRGTADLTSFGPNFNTRAALISPYNLVRWY